MFWALKNICAEYIMRTFKFDIDITTSLLIMTSFMNSPFILFIWNWNSKTFADKSLIEHNRLEKCSSIVSLVLNLFIMFGDFGNVKPDDEHPIFWFCVNLKKNILRKCLKKIYFWIIYKNAIKESINWNKSLMNV